MKSIIGSLVIFQTPWETLSTTLDSFLTAAPNSTIRIWDNSPNGDLENQIVSKYGHQVSYKHSPKNIGYGSGHNRNFEASKCDYFCILNPDVTILKNTINVCHEFLENNPEYGLATCTIKNTNGTTQEVHKPMLSFKTYICRAGEKFLKISRSSTENSPLTISHSTVTFFPMLSGCFMFFKSEHFNELNGFDERFFLYFEDYDLSLRSFLMDKSIVLHSTHIIHQWQRGSHSNKKLFWIHLASGLKFFNKWGFSEKNRKRINNKMTALNFQKAHSLKL